MIALQYISRISVLTQRCSSRTLRIPDAEDIFRYLAMAMVALVMIAGCIHASASLYPKDPPAIRVTVREGDTLWKYAAKYGSKDRYMLSSVEEIARVNNLEKSRAIQPGMQLLIPR